MRSTSKYALASWLLSFAASCSSWEDPGGAGNGEGGAPSSSCAVPPGPSPGELPRTAPTGLHAFGNMLRDGTGKTVFLRGVNRSGTEYSCVSATGGIFDGPSNEASVRAMASWPINAVRIPLNEACWLGINGAPVASTSAIYRKAIADYVLLLQKYGLVPIIDLHWAAAGTEVPRALLPLPNADHTPDFWRSVAETFSANDGVVFELYNEPFWNRHGVTEDEAAWLCWQNGCEMTEVRDASNARHPDYAAVGMQQLVNVVREVGARNLILVGGLQFSNDLSQWLARAPVDPIENLGAAWHVYNFNACTSAACDDGAPEAVAATVPLVATEIGEDDCAGDLVVKPLLPFLDAQAAGYLAWTWNAHGACSPTIRDNGRLQSAGKPWSLVVSYVCPRPNGGYAQAFYDHLQSLVP